MGTKARKASQDTKKTPPQPADTGRSRPPADESLDDRLDEALSESFPASDPPAVHRNLQRGLSFLP